MNFPFLDMAGRRQAVAAVAQLLLALASLFWIAQAVASEYRLGPMDRLRIRVVEWQTAEGAFRDWSGVSGDYTVGPTGDLSLPFIGEAPATGKTTAEIATMIGDRLQQKFGLLDRPEASVEIAEFRPFFVSGDVQTPGKYPYDPGLTVLKALSIAGGVKRAEGGQRAERDFINAQSNQKVLLDERNRLLAKRARLQAEAADKDIIETPEELNDPSLASLIQGETSLMAVRNQSLKLQLMALADLKKLLSGEIEALEKKSVTQSRQLELSRKELADIGNLREQGLVVNTRVSTLERTIADLESRILDIGTNSLRAKQDITKATQDEITLRNDRAAGLAQELQQVEGDLEAVNLKIAQYGNLMSEAMSLSPAAALTANDVRPSFAIVRTSGDKTEEIAAEETTPVLPGDVVKVKVLLPESQ
ncbi:MAG TPA: polysaccharide biosynthesis/export family protein [Rhizobiaceae bacterium]|nr:polysaccharide biosynthesis/export family protein [Rhizobiaceae bacterium]